MAPNDQGHFFDDLQIGQTATPSKMITEEDVLMYSLVSLDTTPFTWTKSPTCHSRFGGRISWHVASRPDLRAPGHTPARAGSIYLLQSLAFRAPVRIGVTVRAIVEITDLNLPRKSATLRAGCMDKEDTVIDGEATVLVPTRD